MLKGRGVRKNLVVRGIQRTQGRGGQGIGKTERYTKGLHRSKERGVSP